MPMVWCQSRTLGIAEAVAGPLLRAERRGPAELELGAVGVADERLAGGTAGRDPEDLGLVVVLAHDVEVQVLADVGLGEKRQLAQIRLRRGCPPGAARSCMRAR